MSMDLYLWKAPVIDDPDGASTLLDRFYDDNDETAFEPSESVTRALARIRELYPDDPGRDDNPWSSWPIEDSDRIIALTIRWSVDGEVLDAIIAVAAEHDLVVYDPQGPDVYRAREVPQPEPVEKPKAKEYFSVIMLFAMIAGATFAAWWFIPWGWVRWPLVVVGLFFTIAAGIVVYATVEAAFVGADEEPRTR